MGLFNKKIGTVFLKEDSDAENFVVQMTELSKKVDGQLKQNIETQIKLANYGIYGEKNIAFELKNSGIDIYVLHDLCLEYSGLKAQIDYLIITRQRIYVVECKNLIGNIEINSNGNFIRTYEIGGKRIKEGMYSPITQNERHMAVIKGLRTPDNQIQKHLFEKYFEDSHKSVVVLSNPKTILNAKFAKKEVKNKVIRADELISYIKEIDKIACCDFKNDEMLSAAKYFFEHNIPERSDYSLRYKEIVEQLKETVVENTGEKVKVCPRCGEKLVLRTAKKGDNAGKQFYGCSAFPKCKYIESVS